MSGFLRKARKSMSNVFSPRRAKTKVTEEGEGEEKDDSEPKKKKSRSNTLYSFLCADNSHSFQQNIGS
jgi:hypothetical protein